jgi:hypothetical protein
MTLINRQILEALGRMTVEFQNLEMVLKFMVQALLDPDPAIGHIVTSLLSFHRLCDVSLALFRQRTKDEELILELEAIVKKAIAAEQERNVYVHSWWAIKANDEGRLPVGRLKSRLKKRELVFDSEDIDPKGDALNALAEEMARVGAATMQLMLKAREKGLLDFPYAVRGQKSSCSSKSVG